MVSTIGQAEQWLFPTRGSILASPDHIRSEFPRTFNLAIGPNAARQASEITELEPNLRVCSDLDVPLS
jgi:hypothetical protein